MVVPNVIIRKYRASDRIHLRRISCETAFVGLARKAIFTDDEVLADALIACYTDFEPESCFVAEVDSRVVGYCVGSLNTSVMNRISRRLMPGIFWKALARGVFLRKENLTFFYYCARSALKGELYAPDFSKEYPATLHINIEDGYRKQGLGQKLIGAFIENAQAHKVPGVHFGAFSGPGTNFFSKMGFAILFQSTRSYLKPYYKNEIIVYVFGKKI